MEKIEAWRPTAQEAVFIEKLSHIFFCSNGTEECYEHGLNWEIPKLTKAIREYVKFCKEEDNATS